MLDNPENLRYNTSVKNETSFHNTKQKEMRYGSIT